MSDDALLLRLLLSFVLGAAVGGALFGLVWPFIGPDLVQPCPMFTTAGVWLFSVRFGIGVAMKVWEKDKRRF